MKLRFNQEDAQWAFDEWGCNCGPSALAAALGMTLDEIRPHMGPFESRGYTNVTNMRKAIQSAGARIVRSGNGWPPVGFGVVRIQWGGPWIMDGKPARWAACATHWVASFRTAGSHLYVFDVNGGLMSVDAWERDIVPRIVASIKRADGRWFISHGWQVATLANDPGKRIVLASGAAAQ